MEGVSVWLSECSDIHLIGQAHTLHGVDQILGKAKPQILLIDLQLSDEQCLPKFEGWLSQWPDLLIMVYASSDECLVAQRCLMAGARGYLMKTASRETFVSAVRHLKDHQYYLSDRVKQQAIESLFSDSTMATRLKDLTPRQHTVLHLISEGLSRQQIADRLGLSVKTVDAHKTNIRERLKLSSGIALTHHAVQFNGLNTYSRSSQ